MSARFSVFVMLTIICGVGVVTFETPQNCLLFVLWLGVTVSVVRRSRNHLSNRRGTAFIHGSIMAAIIMAAILAPVKRIDAVLEQPIQLNATQMTVAQLSEYCQFNRKSMPLKILIPSRGSATKSEIHFTADRMPLKEFVDQVERHTGLKPRFNGCGNAYSILYGGVYNFGLEFIPHAGSEGQWE